MKKVLSFISIFLLALTIVGCKKTPGPDPQPTDAEIVATAKSKLVLSQTEVTENFDLIITGDGGVAIKWASDNDAIKIDGLKGKVTRPEEADVNVTLTATLTKGAASDTKAFSVKVLKKEVVELPHGTIAEAIAAAKDTAVIVQGVVTGFHYDGTAEGLTRKGFYVTDSTGTIYVYDKEFTIVNKIQKGDEVNVSAKRGVYTNTSFTEFPGSIQLVEPTLVATVGNNKTADFSKLGTKTVTELMNTAKTENITEKAYRVTAKIDWFKTASYQSGKIIDPNNEASSVGIYFGGSVGPSADIKEIEFFTANTGKVVDLVFIVNGLTSKGAWRGHILSVETAQANPAQAVVDAVANPFKTSAYTEGATVNLAAKQGEHNLTWASDNAAIAIAAGVATIVVAEGEKNVKVTVSATVDGKTASKTFSVIVGQNDVVDGDSIAAVKALAKDSAAVITGKVVAIAKGASDQFVILADATGSILVDLSTAGGSGSYTKTNFELNKVYNVVGKIALGNGTTKNVLVVANVTAVTEVAKTITTVAAVEVNVATPAELQAFLGTLTEASAGTLFKLTNVTMAKVQHGTGASDTYYTYFKGADQSVAGQNRAGIYHDDVALVEGQTYDIYAYFVGANNYFTQDRILRFTNITVIAK